MVNFSWPIFIAAVLVLVFPITLFLSAFTKDRLAEPHNQRFRLEKGLLVWQNWLDLLRSFAGFYLLAQLAGEMELQIQDEAIPHLEAIVLTTVALPGIVTQTVHHRQRFYCLAPVFYLWGLTLVFSHWIPALFALVFGSMTARLFDHVEMKFPVTAGLLALTGYLTGHFNLLLVINCALLMVPLVLSYMFLSSMAFLTPDVR